MKGENLFLTRQSQSMSRDQLLTKGDLEDFKTEFFNEIKSLLTSKSGSAKTWLRSSEVRKQLGISPGTLQNLRVNGSLPFTKIGGIVYYKQEDITKLMESNHNAR
ncbi:MAG: helix-turn-helix domain-containing protein [Cyclobacteriaceae bacterium]